MENVLSGGVAEQNQHVGSVELDLPGEERRAGLDLFRRGRTVTGRPPIDGIGDVNLVFGQPDSVKHTIEQFPGAADEGLALQIFVAARRFADQHEAGAVMSAREAKVLGRPFERAAFETRHQRFELGKRRGASGRFRRWP